MKTKQNTTQTKEEDTTKRRRIERKKREKTTERTDTHKKKPTRKRKIWRENKCHYVFSFLLLLFCIYVIFFCTPFSRLVWKYLFVSFYSVHWASCWFCSLSIWMHKQIIYIYFYMYIFVTRDPSIQNVHWVRRTSGANKKIEINF